MIRKLIVAGMLGAATMYYFDPINGVERSAKTIRALDAGLQRLRQIIAPAAVPTEPARSPMTAEPDALAYTSNPPTMATAALNRTTPTRRSPARMSQRKTPPTTSAQ